MNTELLTKIEKPFMKKAPKFQVGDTVAVYTIVREGSDKKRIQIFKGLVIAIKGSGTRKMFTVRKISAGIGVEKIFPLNSPNIEKIEVLRAGKVRRSKIYYMRDRIGKQAMKVDEGSRNLEDAMVDDEQVEEEVAEVTTDEQSEQETQSESTESKEESKESDAKEEEKKEEKAS
ncbi:50S ribosomal protein L19 [Candidatus Dojkabacteria bacterium]|uniref:Large ribosomal subunit protein bL19 n=1 Tax=Candidatus Dojkabacteria bacterium TaxID=2099670 RepID=A0A955L560_9BACT|nr:50S ribosomal protein L19 [Candidatus Dojkabacteria bacterium]